MDKIGFKNFRKFVDFPTIDLGGITILVGGNNAGKSTLVKAMLLMQDFLKNRIDSADKTGNLFDPQFKFDTEHVNIGEFYRAFCRQSSSDEDTITFTARIDEFLFTVNISGERKTGIIPQVTMISIADEKRDVSFNFDFKKALMSVRFVNDREALNERQIDKSYYAQELSLLKEKLINSTDLDEITKIKLEIEQFEKKIMAEATNYEIEEYEPVTLKMSPYMRLMRVNVGNLVIPELVKLFVNYSFIETTGNKRSKEYRKEEDNKAILKSKTPLLNDIVDRLSYVISNEEIEYIYAHSVEQQIIYSMRMNEYVNRTIHEFYINKINEGDEEFSFVIKWIKAFEIGKSFEFEPYAGEAYRVYITNENDGKMDLADLGMGSIQMMILLLRLATLMRKYKGKYLTVLLEEPEQNLHPALQSKLVDLLYEVHKERGFNFVVETHSEYLVRNTQVVVAKEYDTLEKLDNVPFKVYFMPKKGLPYPLGYKKSGRFNFDDNEGFGTGFLDEAGKANLYIMRKEKGLAK